MLFNKSWCGFIIKINMNLVHTCAKIKQCLFHLFLSRCKYAQRLDIWNVTKIIFTRATSPWSCSPEAILGPGAVGPGHHSFLVGGGRLQLPRLAVLGPVAVTVSILLILTWLVKLKKPQVQGTDGKFKNPLRNMNVVIIIVILSFTLLQLLSYYLKPIPNLIFPHEPQGFDMTAMMVIFLFNNKEAKQHVLQKIRIFNLVTFVSVIQAEETVSDPNIVVTRRKYVKQQPNQETDISIENLDYM